VATTVAGNGVQGLPTGRVRLRAFIIPMASSSTGRALSWSQTRTTTRLRKIVGGQVTTLSGSSEPGTADSAGADARFNRPFALALNKHGRLLELGRVDTLRVVEASLVAPLWMGPVEEAVEEAEVAMRGKAQAAIAALLQDYAKMVENSEPQLADVVLVVEGERFPARRCVIAARSEYFRCLLLSGMHGGRSEGGVQEIELGEVSAGRSGWCCGTSTRLRCRRMRREGLGAEVGREREAVALGEEEVAREREMGARARIRGRMGRK
jgi:hypothetical protein